VDKYRPCSLGRLDYHKEQAAQLRNLVSPSSAGGERAGVGRPREPFTARAALEAGSVSGKRGSGAGECVQGGAHVCTGKASLECHPSQGLKRESRNCRVVCKERGKGGSARTQWLGRSGPSWFWSAGKASSWRIRSRPSGHAQGRGSQIR
jgi:hypothetical protein